VARLIEVGEQVFVKALVAQSTIEAFDEVILHRFARRNAVPFGAALLLPRQDGNPIEFPGEA
jgi:hypothetical protein